VGVPLLIGATYYGALPPDQKKFIADKAKDLWNTLWGKPVPDDNACEMRGDGLRWDPGDLGPLKDAYGVGKPLPAGDPFKDKDYWKKPSDWDTKSRWQKIKWWLGKISSSLAAARGAGV